MPDVEVDVGIDRRRLNREIAGAERLFASGFDRIRGIGTTALASIGVGFGGGALVGQLREIADGVREIERSAREFGLTNQQFQSLELGAARAGVEVQRLGDFFKDFQERLGEAQNERSGELQTAFDLLGLDPRSFERTEDALSAFLDRIEGLSEQTQRALQGQIAGIGADLDLAALRELEDRINNIRSEGGVVILSDDQIENVRSLAGELDIIQMSFQSGFASEFADDMERAGEAMEGVAELAADIGRGLANAALDIADAINDVREAISDPVGSFSNSAIGRLLGLGTQGPQGLGAGFGPGSFAPPQRQQAAAQGIDTSALADLSDEEQRYLDALQNRLITTTQLTEEERLLSQVQAGLVELTGDNLQTALGYARAIDEARAASQAATEAQRADIQATKERQQALEQAALSQARINNEQQALLDRFDPAQAIRRRAAQDRATADDLFTSGRISEGELGALQERIQEQLDASLEALQEPAREFVSGIVGVLGREFQSAEGVARAVIAQFVSSIIDQLDQGASIRDAVTNVIGIGRAGEIVGDNDSGG